MTDTPMRPENVRTLYYLGWGLRLKAFRPLGRLSTRGWATLPFRKIVAYEAGALCYDVGETIVFLLRLFVRAFFNLLLTLVVAVSFFPAVVLLSALARRRRAREEIAREEER